MLQMKSERLLNCQLDFQKELFLLWHHSLEELQRLRSLKQQENTPQFLNFFTLISSNYFPWLKLTELCIILDMMTKLQFLEMKHRHSLRILKSSQLEQALLDLSLWNNMRWWELVVVQMEWSLALITKIYLFLISIDISCFKRNMWASQNLKY